VPDKLRGRLQLGSYVFVPFGREKLGGYVIGLTAQAPAFDTKDILSLLSDEPVFDEDLLALARWVADRYRAPLADALHLILPPGAAQKPVARVELTEAGRAADALTELAASPRQVELLALLQKAATPLPRSEVIRAGIRAGMKPAAVGGALKGLEERGFLMVLRGLAAPAARRLTRQVVRLAEESEPWLEVIEKLYKRAPRQAEAIERLLEAEDHTVPLADLSHSAVKSLEGKGLVHILEEHVERLPEEAGMGEEEPNFLQLTCAQARILDWVITHLDRREFAACLIHGVTGSGKTEVYLHSIEQTLRRGRNAIVLVPEISLTPQMVGRFRARFGGQLALLHSALSAGERFDEWQRIARGEARIVVGARSALFAPVANLGIIVVDEEHDRAYKQDSSPRYHAVAVAEQRARQADAVLLMGGATPSIESYYHASLGSQVARASLPVHLPGGMHELEARATVLMGASQVARASLPVHPPGGMHELEARATCLMELPERIDDRPMPTVEIIDLRRETLLGRGQTFSQRISDEIQQRIDRGEQVILFLNRRGFSTFVMCRDCGYALRCPDCAVALRSEEHTSELQSLS
jgi:primosomal protein N' (replication factor Y)